MIIEKVERQRSKAYFIAYLHDDPKKRPAVLICPGGGYAHVSPRESKPVADKFFDAGYNAFVINYTVKPESWYGPLQELSWAVSCIKSKKDEFNIDDDRLAVCGFSAGGHLAASLGVHHKRNFSYDPADTLNNKPDALILCYPVITAGKYCNEGSFKNLLGEDEIAETRMMMSLELQVTEDTPKTFLWHTAEDSGVPVENSLLFAGALSRNKVPFEMHIFPYGRHGLSLADISTDVDGKYINDHASKWIDLCIKWLDMEFDVV